MKLIQLYFGLFLIVSLTGTIAISPLNVSSQTCPPINNQPSPQPPISPPPVLPPPSPPPVLQPPSPPPVLQPPSPPPVLQPPPSPPPVLQPPPSPPPVLQPQLPGPPQAEPPVPLPQQEPSFGTRIKSFGEIQNELLKIEQATGVKPAIIYASFSPRWAATDSEEPIIKVQPQPTDELELVLVTSKGKPIRRFVHGATKTTVLETATNFSNQLKPGNKVEQPEDKYKEPAKQLYQWLIAPLEADLKNKNIGNLVFVMDDDGLRSLPLAALYDGEKGEFLVEQYSVGLMPSMSLTDTRYVDIRKLKLIAMGASNIPDSSALRAVSNEIKQIKELWDNKVAQPLENEAFNLTNLKLLRRNGEQPFGIVHLASHATFNFQYPSKSYIKLWDSLLILDEFRKLNWNKPPVELLVLSACETAIGNEHAELGFAGLAYQLGVKSVLGSLWTVDDTATLELMKRFYIQFKYKKTLKAEALRQAQLSMLKDKNLSHPHYWSGFTIVGNPW